MKEAVLEIDKTQIFSSDLGIVMHEWESPIMEEKAKWVCQNGGDILEIGFGMGISAGYIQKQKINSHTICEINPQILENLYKWAQDKPNVTILEGDWYDNIDKMSKYHGILYDPHNDKHWQDFKHVVPKIANSKCKITWWNNHEQAVNLHKLKETIFEVLDVNPPKNTYFNHKHYHIPKCTYNA